MPRSPATSCLVLLSWTLAACREDVAPDAPPFEFDPPAAQSSLDNGLELVVLPNHTAPVVTALVAFRAGAFVEDEAINGCSHLFEHMIFEGSAAVPDPGAFRDQLRALGVSTNATTNVDRVTYYFNAAREALEPALELFAGALREPLLDEASLDKERRVVLAEFDRNESQTDFAPRKEAMRALFGDYVTRLDPLGSRAAVERVTRDELLALHAKYYVPNNAVLVLSGDVTPEQGRALAERYFGDWERAPDPLAEPPPQPGRFERSRYLVVETASSFMTIDVWYRGPNAADTQDALAGTLLSMVTGHPSQSFRSLVRPELGQAASLEVASFRSAGYVHAQVVARPGNELAVLEEMPHILEQLGAPGDVLLEQLSVERAQAFRGVLLTSVEPASVPHRLGYYWGSRDTRAYFDYIDQLYACSPREVERFAQTYLWDRPKVVVVSANRQLLDEQGIDAHTLSEGWSWSDSGQEW